MCLVGKVAYDLRVLSLYRSRIEKRYGPQIALIEQTCRSFPKGVPSPSDEDRLRDREIVETVRKSLSADKIYSASCSFDGHHGLTSLKPMETGYSTYEFRFLTWHDAGGRYSLFYGKSVDNRKLLVYEGRIQAPRMRRYRIVFTLDDINNAANVEKPQSPPLRHTPLSV